MIKPYLTALSKLIGVPVDKLKLVREVTDVQWKKSYPEVKEDDEYFKPDMGYGARLRPYQVRDGNDTIVTSFGLYEFPSCCAFVVSTQAFVDPRYRGKKVNKLTNKLRQNIASALGYTAIICTDVDDNVAERATLAAEGWKDIYQVRNKRTGNLVNISVKELKNG